jgi:uncharacterized damage-inducible protein DinB
MTYYGAPELARSFRVVRRNTLIIAEDIPLEQYGFRPAPDSRSVAEILAHIAVSSQGAYQGHVVRRIQTFVGVDFRAVMKQRQEQELQLTTKPDILAALRSNGEAWGTFLDGVTDEVLAETITFPEPAVPQSKSRFEMILSVKEHEMHHRAQLMVIERLLGLVPHLTRERQAMASNPAPTRTA